MKQVLAQLGTLDPYDAAAVQMMSGRLKDVAAGIGKVYKHFAAIRPPAWASKSHQMLLTAFDELQKGLGYLAACIVSHNHAEYDMGKDECHHAVQDVKEWIRLLKTEAKKLRVKIPSGLRTE